EVLRTSFETFEVAQQKSPEGTAHSAEEHQDRFWKAVDRFSVAMAGAAAYMKKPEERKGLDALDFRIEAIADGMRIATDSDNALAKCIFRQQMNNLGTDLEETLRSVLLDSAPLPSSPPPTPVPPPCPTPEPKAAVAQPTNGPPPPRQMAAPPT